jgi:hypothetical protein
MPDYEVMAHAIELPIYAEDPMALPVGWEPISTLSRQGNKAIILCRRLAQAPSGGAPVLTSLTPNTLAAGTTPATVDVAGSGFDANTTVNADGVPRSTFYLDATHLQYTARPDLATSGQVVQITVSNDSGSSDPLTFTYS